MASPCTGKENRLFLSVVVYLYLSPHCKGPLHENALPLYPQTDRPELSTLEIAQLAQLTLTMYLPLFACLKDQSTCGRFCWSDKQQGSCDVH